jgi:hypothetical protein
MGKGVTPLVYAAWVKVPQALGEESQRAEAGDIAEGGPWPLGGLAFGDVYAGNRVLHRTVKQDLVTYKLGQIVP